MDVTHPPTPRDQPPVATRAKQATLHLTGHPTDTAHVVALLNRHLVGRRLTLDPHGRVALHPCRTATSGLPQRRAITQLVQKLITPPQPLAIHIGYRTATLLGDYQRGLIDAADLEALGQGQGLSAVSALLHELEEQYQRQVCGRAYAAAHRAAVTAEERIIGARRGRERYLSHTINRDQTINALIEIPYSYPNGLVVTVEMVVRHNQLQRVVRRVAPTFVD